MSRIAVVACSMGLAVISACGAPNEPAALGRDEQAVFDCNDTSQRLTCAPPDDPDKRFVCHATSSSTNPYNKIAVPIESSAHIPGSAHGAGKPADQAPGASGADVGAGPGLDCECNIRICADVCTGAEDGDSCDDNDVCTTDGSCAGGTCAPGEPRCIADTPVDACNVEDGVCDPDTGACGTTPVAGGTSCGPGQQCDGAGTCTALHVVINEAESSGGVPGDWVELYNAGATTAFVGGWVFKDNDDTHGYALPPGTTIAAGAYLVLDEAQFGFGLGAADATRLYDGAVLVDSYSWTAHAVTTYGRCPDGSGGFRTTTTPTKGAANDCRVLVNLNEIESSGGVPGDWVELYNAGPVAAAVGGYRFLDNDDAHTPYVIPAGTTIAAAGYLVLDEAQFGFGLGAADSARLYDADGALVQSYSWTTHATTTWGRCPNGTGAFATTASSTKAAANACSGTPPPTTNPWPGQNNVTAIDVANTYGTNMSGLVHDGTDLWAVQNSPSRLYRIGGPQWTLRYPDGTGAPDAEDVTIVGGFAYVASERDNTNGGVSRPSILRYDTTASGELIATHEWNLVSDLPAVGANLGIEAITWIPDSFLVANGFIDQTTHAPYNPASFPGHGAGLFFVGLEANGTIYAYALDHVTGGFTRIASFASGDPTSKALSFDPESGYLWQHCGVSCAGQTRVLVPGGGAFVTKRVFDLPSTMANYQNEGIALTPCTAGSKRYFWADDSQTDGHALRADTVPCGAFIP